MMAVTDLAPEQRRAFVAALLFVATVDGEYHPAEEAFVRSVFQAASLPQEDEQAIKELLSARPALDDVLAPVNDPLVSRLLVRELLSLAYADGSYSDVERAGVVMISGKLRLPEAWVAAMEAWVTEGIAWQKRGAALLET